jgi:hypothetical protein
MQMFCEKCFMNTQRKIEKLLLLNENVTRGMNIGNEMA